MMEVFVEFLMLLLFLSLVGCVVVLIYLQTEPFFVRKIKSLFVAWRKLGVLGMMIVGLFAGDQVVRGSTKHNSLYGFAKDVYQTMFASRPNAVANAVEDWNLNGAWEKGEAIEFPGKWVFPYGTNHLSWIYLWSQGSIFETDNAIAPIASVPVNLAIKPRSSYVCHGLNADNEYCFSWTNAHPNRIESEMLNAEIILSRNGDWRVATNGCVVTSFVRGVPFAHNGIGQDESWVNANFAASTNEIATAGGYLNWVNSCVGTNKLNGLYKFTVQFADVPEATELVVGDYSVAVTNAGEYVFLLKKGFEYEFYTKPYTENINCFAIDDLSQEHEWQMVMALFGDDTRHGEWSVDKGWCSLKIPTMLMRGQVYWRFDFYGSPNVSHMFPAGEYTFTAVMSDYIGDEEFSYEWSTSCQDIKIVSPNTKETVVKVGDKVPNWKDSILTVKAYNANSNSCYESHLNFSYGTNSTPQVHLSIDMPRVMFTNDDDDNDDGNIDYDQAFVFDDDIVSGRILFSSDVPTNGIIKISKVDGYETGFTDKEHILFFDNECTQPVEEGAEIEINEYSPPQSISLYINPVVNSSSLDEFCVEVKWIPDDGGDIISREAKATIVYPVVEPICNDTKVVDGEVYTYNPCGVAIGENAYFKIDVMPAMPNESIEWIAEGGLAFVGDNHGTNVCVRGVSEGNAKLKINMRDSTEGMPEFNLFVTEKQIVPIHAMILVNELGPCRTQTEVEQMIVKVNEVYSQIGMEFVLSSCVITNVNSDATICEEGETNTTHLCFDQLVDFMSNTGGVECYFVNDFVKAENTPSYINGLADLKGIAIAKTGSYITLAHEIGHACDTRDIYTEYGGDGLNLRTEKISYDKCCEDWNGGCCGSSYGGARYYSSGQQMEPIVMKLLMYGYASEDKRDMTLGDVFGVNFNSQENEYEKSITNIGFKDAAGFKKPISQ